MRNIAVTLLLLMFLPNKIHGEQFLINNEDGLLHVASCAATCLNTNKSKTLGSCYDTCYYDDETELDVEQQNPDLYLVCRESEIFVVRINLTGIIDDDNDEGPQFVYLFKAEQGAEELIYMTDVSIVMFRNVPPGQTFNVSATIITSNRDVFFTQTITVLTMYYNYTPGNVTAIQPIEFHVNPRNFDLVNVRIGWKPAADMACFYDILYHSYTNEEGIACKSVRKPGTLFEYEIEGLRHDEEYRLAVMALTSDSRISDLHWVPLLTPTCNSVHNYNSTLCAPDEVFGLVMECKVWMNKTATITVKWNPPHVQPDYYIFEMYVVNNFTEPIVEAEVPGNITRFSFNHELNGTGYVFKMFAVKDEKVSKPTQELKHFDLNWIEVESEAKELFYWDGIIVTLCIIACIIFGVMICLCVYRPKKNEEIDESLESSVIIELQPPGVNDPMEIEYDSVEFFEIMGEGAFGIVRMGQISKNNTEILVAAKQLKTNELPTQAEIKEFQREISLMKSVGKHPNVLAIVGHCTKNLNQLTLLTEFCSKGNLRDFLRVVASTMKQRIHENGAAHNIEYGFQTMSFATLLNFAEQIATGMEYLAKQRVVHRDLAARNVLVSEDLTLKVSDFGLSRDVYLDSVYMKRSGGKLPIKWLAIESLTHQEYTTKSDVWSYGILLYEICTLGGLPYPGIQVHQLIEMLVGGYRMNQPVNCSNDLYQLMCECWMGNPDERPTFTEMRERIEGLVHDVNQPIDEYVQGTESGSDQETPIVVYTEIE